MKKHDVDFEEAKTVFNVFNDLYAITANDPDHSFEEERYLNIGISSKGRILVVWYTERDNNIRLIVCRKASRNERKTYEKG